VPPVSASPFQPLLGKLESASALDGLGQAIGKAVRGVIGPGAIKDALSGTWLGHPLHPVLTDVVIGSFVSASLLDALDLVTGDDDGALAAERLIGIGIAAYGPTAAAGINDWADTELADGRARRVGLVHATTNATALSLYGASLAARRAGDDGRGRALSLAGAAALVVGGYLGGHLSFVQAVGPNQTAFDAGISDWTPAIDSGELETGTPKSVVVDETPVLLLRHGNDLHAMHDRCSHRGCSLASGELDGHMITCACHGSRFDVRDGSVLRGPATAPQPVYDAREIGGRIELKLRG
jgi:nitrite reductase/ring-hydroxylating ferredoxin subunit/uncharacterized membrane protein